MNTAHFDPTDGVTDDDKDDIAATLARIFAGDFAAAEPLSVTGPLYMRTTPAGTLEILCYRTELGNDTGNAVPTVIQFLPDAAGQLVHDLHTSVMNGELKLAILRDEKPMQ